MACCCSWFKKRSYKDFDEDGNKFADPGAPPPQMMGRAERNAGSQVKVPVEVLRKKVEQAKQTRVLAFRECGLKSLPKESLGAELAVLRTVDLSANKITSLPEDIKIWSNLQKLQCEQNQLQSVPASIGQLASLDQLVLSQNKLRTLPSEIACCGKLKILLLDRNGLGPALPEVFDGAIAASLEELNLSCNGLVDLAQTLASCVALHTLSVSDNKLTVLSENLGSLQKLTTLDASQNSLRNVPRQLFDETRLSDLQLKGNPMERLELQKTPGFDAFLERRKAKLDAKIGSNVVGKVDLTVCGLD